METLDTSWLNGKYTLSTGIAEINTKLPYISFIDNEGNKIFMQEHEAEEPINEIYYIWASKDITTEQAFQQYINLYY